MNDRPIITVENVSMAYKLYARPVDMLKESLFGRVHHDTFWALKDVSFTVREKQRVGIIGHNGAGKSTLLQTIAGNLKPTGGRVDVHGTISSLLSLAPAWNPEMSGMENIRFNLLMQGVDPAKIPMLTEDIVEFTELGAFIYQPVRTYSSGMSARLSFAIGTAIQPDILIIDEVLATGDAYFAGKAYKRMVELCSRGRALLFVSHAMDAVQRLCNFVIWMQNGTIRQAGPVERVLKDYESDYKRQQDEELHVGNALTSSARRGGVTVHDISSQQFVRFRLMPEHGDHFTTTHYVRRVCIKGLSAEPSDLPIEMVDLEGQDSQGGLDVLASEWGRIYERRGRTCRTLGRASGKSGGGHILLRQPINAKEGERLPVSAEIEFDSAESGENLRIELLDMTEGRWRELPNGSTVIERAGWKRLTATGEVVIPSATIARTVAERVAALDRPKVEIEDAWIEVRGQRALTVREREPFGLMVRIQANTRVPLADVGVKLIRSDGIYAFWQSSGFEPGGNLRALEGWRTIGFHFETNSFGAGEYQVTLHVTSGWNYPDNYPYSEVFCREVGRFKFRVLSEFEGLDFGIVNQRARVEVV